MIDAAAIATVIEECERRFKEVNEHCDRELAAPPPERTPNGMFKWGTGTISSESYWSDREMLIWMRVCSEEAARGILWVLRNVPAQGVEQQLDRLELELLRRARLAYEPNGHHGVGGMGPSTDVWDGWLCEVRSQLGIIDRKMLLAQIGLPMHRRGGRPGYPSEPVTKKVRQRGVRKAT